MPDRYRPNGYRGPTRPPEAPSFGDYGRLDQRVSGMEASLSNVIAAMDRDRQHNDQQFAALREHSDRQFRELQEALSKRSQIPWPGISAGLVALGMVGGALWYPVQAAQVEQKEMIRSLQTNIVPRVEHEKEWRRAEETVKALRVDINENQRQLVPKDIFTATTTALQRQTDEIRKDIGGVVTTRDILQSYEKKMDRMEAELRRLSGHSNGNGGAPAAR